MQAFRGISAVVILFGALLLFFLWTGLYYIVQSERQLEINNAYKDTANYARLFEEHTVRTIKGLDQIALFLKYQGEKDGLGLDLVRFVKEERFAGQPLVQLSIADVTGNLVTSSIDPFVSSNIADREHFLVHKEVDKKELFISKPLIGRLSGKWSIQLSRRINKADGSFGGVAVVSVDPYYFAQFYKQVDLGKNSLIALIGRDGTLRVRQSGDEVSIGLDFSQRVRNELSKGDVGNYTDKSIVDGTRRFFSYRTL